MSNSIQELGVLARETPAQLQSHYEVVGTLVEYTGTLEAKIDGLKSSAETHVAQATGLVDDLATELGGLQETLDGVVNEVREALEGAEAQVEAFDTQIQEGIEAASTRVSEFRGHIEEVRDRHQEVVEVAHGALGTLSESIDAAENVVRDAGEFASNRVGELTEAVEAGAETLSGKVSEFHGDVEEKTLLFTAAVTNATDRLGSTLSELNDGMAHIATLFSGNADELEQLLQSAVESMIAPLLQETLETIRAIFDEVTERLTGDASELGEMRDLLKPLISELQELFEPLMSSVAAVERVADDLGVG